MKITNKMYGGDVLLQFDTLRHQYSIDGKPVPGVTTVLGIVAKGALIYWSANCAADYFREHIEVGKSYDEVQLEEIWRGAKRAHTQKKDNAAGIGGITHKWVQEYIEGKRPEMPTNEVVKGAVERFLKWKNENHVEFLLSEQPCYSVKNHYAGIIDFICRVNGKLYCGDLKTNNAFYANSMFSQVSAYKMCREEEFGEKFAGILVCRVGKADDEFEVQICEDTKLFEDNFLNALKLYNSENKIKDLYEKPNNR